MNKMNKWFKVFLIPLVFFLCVVAVRADDLNTPNPYGKSYSPERLKTYFSDMHYVIKQGSFTSTDLNRGVTLQAHLTEFWIAAAGLSQPSFWRLDFVNSITSQTSINNGLLNAGDMTPKIDLWNHPASSPTVLSVPVLNAGTTIYYFMGGLKKEQ